MDTATAVTASGFDRDKVNLGDLDFWLRDDRHSALAWLRREEPVSWHEHPDAGKGFWSLVCAADIAEVARTPDTFVSSFGVRVYHDRDESFVRPGTSTMRELDPPEHTRHRRVVSQAFTPKALAGLDASIETYVERIVHDLSGESKVEFVGQVAARLPVQVICEMTGVPESDREYLVSLTNKTMGDQDPDYGSSPEAGSEAVRRLNEYGLELAARRRAKPGDDLFSRIVAAKVDDQPLSEAELGGFFALLMVGGSETTRTAISHAMLAFTDNPDQRELWKADPAGRSRSATEEILRWATPVRHVARVVARDVDFHGVWMSKGDKVALWLESANRDETVFDRPFAFDIARPKNTHSAFGAPGPHFCLGANLARREIPIMFTAFYRAFPEAAVTRPPGRLRSLLVNGITKMEVALNG